MGAFELLLEKEEGMPSPDFKDKKALLFIFFKKKYYCLHFELISS